MSRKHSLAARAVIGLGRTIWWITKNIAIGTWWVGKQVLQSSKLVATHVQKKVDERAAPKTPSSHNPVGLVSAVKGDFRMFERRLHNDSSIILIAGRRGSGKSVTGFRFLENIHALTQRPCYAIGPSQAVLPSWILAISDLEQASNRGAILVDEGAVAFSSRESMSKRNRQLGELLAIARHKDLSLILITQNTGMIDKNVLSLCDSIVFKEGSLLQERMERSAIKDLYVTANASMQNIVSEERNQHCYVVDAAFEGMCKVPLPSFWSDKVSKNQALRDGNAAR